MLKQTGSSYFRDFMQVWRLLLLALLIFFPGQVFAHSEESLPSLKVNKVYVDEYSVPLTSTKFNIPEDAAKNSFLVGEPISFEIDRERLSVSDEIVQKAHLSWDFGDSQKAEGLKNSHAYDKPGSYIVTVDAQYDEIAGKQQLQSVLINVLPDAGYKIPKAVILVNGKKSADSVVDTLKFDFGKELAFDASASKTGSSKIVEYIWDFGDGENGDGVSVKHRYSKDLIADQVFPVLRVKDENGFFSDSYIQISKSEEGENQTFSNKLILALAVIFAALTAVFVILLWKK